jgi:hypothetical protein
MGGTTYSAWLERVHRRSLWAQPVETDAHASQPVVAVVETTWPRPLLPPNDFLPHRDLAMSRRIFAVAVHA